MKKIFTFCILTFIYFSSIWADDIVDSFAQMATKLIQVDNISSKPRYAFITLASDTEDLEICECLTDALMEATYYTGQIRIIDDATANQIGKVAGVDYICYGFFSEIEGQYFVKVRVTDVQNDLNQKVSLGFVIKS